MKLAGLRRELASWKLEELATQEEELRLLQRTIQDCLHNLGQWRANNQQAQKIARLHQLLRETSYVSPTYEDFFYEGFFKDLDHPALGVCTLRNQETAEELRGLLRERSYYFAHELIWTGPGVYRIIPSAQLDHDREVIYTAKYVKLEDL